MTPLRDLYIVTYAPKLGTGRAMRTFSCVKALSLLGPVDLAYVPHDGDEPSPEYQAIGNLEFHQIKPSRGMHRALTYAGKRLQGIPPAVCRGTSPEVVEAGERLAAAPGRGRVVVDGGSAATAMMPLARRRPVIYNAHNVESVRVGASPLLRLGMRNFERRVMNRASESWMVSRADVNAAAKIAPAAHLRYVPNVVDVAVIEPRLSARERGGEAANLLMVADFRYTPNRTGRDLMIDEVLPLVWESEPDARLTLVGRGLGAWEPPDPRIVVAGFVDTLAPSYAAADCVVVPLVEGAGSPLKFVEALAYGVPVVATGFAAKGLEVVAGKHYLEGSDGPSLASSILSVLSGSCPNTGAEGRRLAESEYSVEALAERIAVSPDP